MTRKHAGLAFLQHGPVAQTSHNQIWKTGIQPPSSVVQKPNENWNETVTNPCLKVMADISKHLRSDFSKDVTQIKCLTKEKEMKLFLPSSIRGQTDNHMDCSEVTEDTALVVNNSDSESKQSHKRLSSIKVSASKNSFILAKPDNAKRKVTFSEDSKQCCHDDHKFGGSREGFAKLLTSGNVSTDRSSFALSPTNNESYFVAALITPDSTHPEGSPHVHSSDPQHLPDVCNQKSANAAGCTLSGSSPATTHVYCHALVLPLRVPREDLELYQVLPLFGAKEKLTRRQMFQLAAMMALGFVFVVLILGWLLSPVLF